MTGHEARDIADAGFSHIAADAELIEALLAQSGSDVAGLRAMAARPEFAVFVLDFLLEQDQRVLDFAAGVVDTRAVVWYGSATVLLLFLSIRILEARRLR